MKQQYRKLVRENSEYKVQPGNLGAISEEDAIS
jgi:hypothetical protein